MRFIKRNNATLILRLFKKKIKVNIKECAGRALINKRVA